MTGKETFRADVEGMRGIAILLVILYHAKVPGFAGGYVGVDVFYVLSGYLITGLIVREIATTGTLSFRQFYARRARRLLPASALVLLATLAVGWLILAPEEQRILANTALTSAAYMSNMYLAVRATDYLAAEGEHNPLLHTWSLAVEEQFYLVWPLLVYFAFRGGRRRLLWVMVGVAAVSLLSSAWLTRTAQPWAFFSSPTRAWEFALGALACLLPAIRDARATPVLLGGGLAAVIGASLTFSGTTAFPGLVALIPVIGTCAMLIAGASGHRGRLAAALESRPMLTLGRLSYSWYLWHWPILVFAAVLFGELTWPVGLALSAGALGLSQLTFVLIESPVRRTPLLVPRPILSLAAASLLTIGTLGLSGWTRAAALDAMTAPDQQVFTKAYRDRPVVTDNGCQARIAQVETPDCVFGRRDADTTLVLFGDSHAGHWFPALERLAEQRAWRLVSMTKAACPAADVDLRNPEYRRPYYECEEWRERALDRIVTLHPTVVVIANKSSRYVSDGMLAADSWRLGMRRTLQRLNDAGIRTVVIRDTPRPGFDVPSCLARATWTTGVSDGACRFARTRGGDDAAFQLVREAAAGLSQVIIADMSLAICGGDVCESMRDGRVLYYDDDHLSASFVVTLAPALLPSLLGTAEAGRPVGGQGETHARRKSGEGPGT